MTRLIDLWRAVDPDTRLITGDVERLGRAVRGVLRTRAAPPHLPGTSGGDLLVVDTAVLGSAGTRSLLAGVSEADLTPAAVMLAAVADPARVELPPADWPVFASGRPADMLSDAATDYLDDEPAFIERFATSVRLAAAEAALADPSPAAPAGVVSGRLRRGVAVAIGGELRTLHPRPAGRALAARFAAVHARLLAGASAQSGTRRTREGLWLAGQPIQAGASVWLFDDLPIAEVDTAALAALAITLRALLRRPATSAAMPSAPPPGRPTAERSPVHETLLAVARANGRIAPAARSLGVHRNTVLYRLKMARAEHGIDPRRSADALRLLREAEETRPEA
jgi:hypothetical protein